jgi:hypothetical protein
VRPQNKKNYIKGKAMTTFSIGLGNRETLTEALDRLDHELPHLSIDYLLGGYNLWREGCGDCDDARLTEVWNKAFDPEIREEVRARRKARKAGRKSATL